MNIEEYQKLINYYAMDILKSQNIEKEKNCLQHGNVSVYEHSMRVAISCLKLADDLKINVDKISLIRGAILHDYFLYDWHTPHEGHNFHAFRHGKTAFKNAKKEFNINKIEQNMIESHMFPLCPAIPKYKESIILTIADKLSTIKEVGETIILKPKKNLY